MIMEPIAAISATNDILISSKHSQVKHNNNKACETNASTIFLLGKFFVATTAARALTAKAEERLVRSLCGKLSPIASRVLRISQLF
jgi:hypothetical protein